MFGSSVECSDELIVWSATTRSLELIVSLASRKVLLEALLSENDDVVSGDPQLSSDT